MATLRDALHQFAQRETNKYNKQIGVAIQWDMANAQLMNTEARVNEDCPFLKINIECNVISYKPKIGELIGNLHS